jgi:hypothetical protein
MVLNLFLVVFELIHPFSTLLALVAMLTACKTSFCFFVPDETFAGSSACSTLPTFASTLAATTFD